MCFVLFFFKTALLPFMLGGFLICRFFLKGSLTILKIKKTYFSKIDIVYKKKDNPTQENQEKIPWDIRRQNQEKQTGTVSCFHFLESVIKLRCRHFTELTHISVPVFIQLIDDRIKKIKVYNERNYNFLLVFNHFFCWNIKMLS